MTPLGADNIYHVTAIQNHTIFSSEFSRGQFSEKALDHSEGNTVFRTLILNEKFNFLKKLDFIMCMVYLVLASLYDTISGVDIFQNNGM